MKEGFVKWKEGFTKIEETDFQEMISKMLADDDD